MLGPATTPRSPLLLSHITSPLLNPDLVVRFNLLDMLVLCKGRHVVLGEGDPAVLISTTASTSRGVVILEPLDQGVLVADLASLLDGIFLGPAKVNIPTDELWPNLLGLLLDLLIGGTILASDLNCPLELCLGQGTGMEVCSQCTKAW